MARRREDISITTTLHEISNRAFQLSTNEDVGRIKALSPREFSVRSVGRTQVGSKLVPISMREKDRQLDHGASATVCAFWMPFHVTNKVGSLGAANFVRLLRRMYIFTQ